MRLFLLGVSEGHCLCAFTPRLSPDFCNRITTVVALVDRDMLTCVWNEMDYHIDVCHITKGGYMSICEICLKKKNLERVSLSLLA